MPWAKLDDRFDDNRKVKRAWRTHPRAVGLYAMAITYCSRHETDGMVDVEWLHERLPNQRDYDGVLKALVDAELFVQVDESFYAVHDYLKHNPSRSSREAKRQADRERKARGGRADSARNRNGRQAESGTPHPSPPIPAHPSPTTARPAAAVIAPQPVRSALTSAGFDPIQVDQSDGAIQAVLAEFNPPADVDWYRTGQEIRKAREAGKLRTDRPDSALRFIAKGISGFPRIDSSKQPGGPAADFSAYDAKTIREAA